MAGIPQVITEDRASGAQFIDGSLKFDSSKGQYLKRTPTANGNRKLWTWSGWLKQTPGGSEQDMFSAGQQVTNDGRYSRFRLQNDSLNLRQWVEPGPTLDASLISSMKLRDPSAFFHCVMIYDVDNSTNTDKVRWYINGQRVTSFSATVYPGSESWVNSSSKIHTIGGHYDGGGTNADSFWNGHMSQVYFLDGIAAGPEEFGYTDPLTGTWRPKKYTGAFTRSSVNNGTNWTQSLSAGVGSLSNGSYAFDGNLSTRAQTANAAPGKELTFSPPAINFTTSLEVYCDQGSAVPTATWNGNTVNPGQGAWVTVYSGSGELSATYPLVINTESAAQYATLKGVRIDGEILIDNLNDNGANSFYLPMDGNTPIGKDQSGNGNDWTPVGFGGSVDLPKATGAIPIHNTNEAGTVAKGGVRTDKKTYTVTASGGNYYIDGALKPTLNAYRGGSYTFDYTGATSHPLYLSSLPDGRHDSSSYSVALDGTGDYLSIPANADFELTGEFTLEYFLYLNSSSSETPVVSWGNGSYKTLFKNGDTWTLEYPSTALSLGGSVSANVGNWKHYALSRDSNNVVRWFIDGKLISTNTVSATIGANDTFTPGFKSNSSNYLHGYISNFRLVKGQALYTSSFTPPSSTLTTTSQGATASNVKLLCCRAEQATTATVSPGTITAAGDAQTTQVHQPFLYNANGVNGVNTGTSNTTKITIPHTAADTLYYYCHNHSGMGSSINVTTDIRKADPYAWKCFLACPYAGDEFDVSDQINCNSTASAATNWNSVQGRNGGTFYNSGRYFDGNSDNINYAGKQEFNFTGVNKAFTIEFFATPSSGSSDGAPISSKGYYSNYGNWYFRFSTTNGGRINFYSYDGQSNGQNNEFQNLGCTDPSKVHHVVCQRDENNLMTFILDGVIVGQASNVTRALDDGLQSGLTVGRIPSNNTTNSAHNWYLGYITDLRIYSGLAKYSGSVGDHVFTPPSVTPDVLPDSPSGITGKTNLAKITEGAVSFDGTGDYLTVDGPGTLAASSNWCMECFFYCTGNSSGTYRIMSANESAQSSEYILMRIRLGQYQFSTDTANSGTINTAAFNKWTHMAFTKEGTTVRGFVDGKKIWETTDNNTVTITNLITGWGYGGEYFQGHISNARFVNGSSVYTADFTPPTAPLTNITNTKLLCCQSTTSASAVTVAPGTFVNDGTNYSSGSQVTGSSGLNYVDSLFDGRLKASGASAGEGATVSISSDNYILWTPTTGIPYSSKVEVYCYAANGYEITNYYSFNGGTETTFTGGSSNFNGNNWITVATGSGTINSIKIRITRGSGNQTSVGWYAVRVDGTILINDYNGKSLAKFGDASATNFNPFTDDINTIRGQASGYATLNPLNVTGTLSDGNLSFYRVAKGGTTSTIGVESGKIYVEAKGDVGNGGFGFGFVQSNYTNDGLTDIGDATNSFGIRATNSNVTFKIQGATNTGININSTLDTIFAYAVDFDTGLVKLLRDGDIIHSQTLSLASGTYYVAVASETGSATKNVHVNFGQKPFKFPPPDGFQPLNLSNVQPEKVIARPDQYVSTTLYTGTGVTPAAALADTTIDTSTAYRYHRILFEGDNNGGSLSEIEFYDANDVKIDASDTNNANGSVDTNGTSALAGWTAFNGTRGGANYAAGVRKDGGVGSAGFYISKDWGAGQSKTIYGVKVWGVNSYGLAGNTAGRYMKLQGSNDNSSWTDLQTWNEARYGTSWTTSSSTEVGHVSDTTSTSSQRITGLNHKPDLVWIKSRSFSNNHHLFDTVRGPNKILRSSTTDQEGTANVMTSFNNDGFTVAEAGGNNATNDGGSTFVGWTWKAGGDKNTFNIDDVGYANASDVNMNVGGLNSSAYTTISSLTSNLTNTIPTGGVDVLGNWFNGQKSNKFEPSGSGSIDFTNVSALQNFSGTLQFAVTAYNPNSAMQFTINASSDNLRFNSPSFPASGGFPSQLLTIPVTSLETLDFVNYSGSSVQFWGIYLDGKLLVDSTATPDNVPSTAPTGCSVGTKQGFSIIKYTGPNDTNNHTVPHGLLQEPNFIITKNLDTTFNWDIYHSSLANDKYLIFTTADERNQGFSGRPTSKVFNTEHDYSTNENQDYIAYCWHDVSGLQKFGKYVGNGSADGLFIELGFRPAIVWVKRSDAAGEPWVIYDSSRGPINPNPKGLYANDSASENDASARYKDFLSNGFKVRGTSGEQNTNGATYIYCAWAEAPTVNLYGGHANAR